MAEKTRRATFWLLITGGAPDRAAGLRAAGARFPSVGAEEPNPQRFPGDPQKRQRIKAAWLASNAPAERAWHALKSSGHVEVISEDG